MDYKKKYLKYKLKYLNARKAFRGGCEGAKCMKQHKLKYSSENPCENWDNYKSYAKYMDWYDRTMKNPNTDGQVKMKMMKTLDENPYWRESTVLTKEIREDPDGGWECYPKGQESWLPKSFRDLLINVDDAKTEDITYCNADDLTPIEEELCSLKKIKDDENLRIVIENIADVWHRNFVYKSVNTGVIHENMKDLLIKTVDRLVDNVLNNVYNKGNIEHLKNFERFLHEIAIYCKTPGMLILPKNIMINEYKNAMSSTDDASFNQYVKKNIKFDDENAPSGWEGMELQTPQGFYSMLLAHDDIMLRLQNSGQITHTEELIPYEKTIEDDGEETIIYPIYDFNALYVSGEVPDNKVQQSTTKKIPFYLQIQMNYFKHIRESSWDGEEVEAFLD